MLDVSGLNHPSNPIFLTYVSKIPNPIGCDVQVSISGWLGYVLCAAILIQHTISAAEYTAKGIVKAEAFFYDNDGNRLDKGPDPDLPRTFTSQFVYLRKGNQWRLNISHPDPNFEANTVWRSIMPFSGSNIIDIISFPERTNVAGNASVTILDSRFLEPDSFGAHFAWTALNYDEIKSFLGPKLECYAFWKPGLPIDPGIKTYQILESNSGWTYWNSGRFVQQDAEGRAVLSGGKPLMQTYPEPFDKGFSEGEFQIEWTSAGQQRVPRRVRGTFMGPGRKPNKGAISMIPLSNVELVVDFYGSDPIDDDVFQPRWTNSVASIVDCRVTNQHGAPLSFLTKTNTISSSLSTLNRHRHISDTIKSVGKPFRNNIGTLSSILISFILIAPAFYLFKRK